MIIYRNVLLIQIPQANQRNYFLPMMKVVKPVYRSFKEPYILQLFSLQGPYFPALTAYEVCAEIKLSIPGDVKILCFSNLNLKDFFTLPSPPFRNLLMNWAEKQLLYFLNFWKKGHHFLQEKTVLASVWMVRNSTKNNA